MSNGQYIFRLILGTLVAIIIFPISIILGLAKKQ